MSNIDYFPSLFDERNNIILEVGCQQDNPILVRCNLAKALKFMGDRIHLIIDKDNKTLQFVPHYSNAPWKTLRQPSPLWLASYRDEAIELVFNGSEFKHQQIKYKLLNIIKELASINVSEDISNAKIKGSFSYEEGILCFSLSNDNIEVVKDDSYEEFKKYASDSNYYRIKISDKPYYFHISCRSEIYRMAEDFCQVLKDKDNYLAPVFGQITPVKDIEQFRDDEGNYLFIKVCSVQDGEQIEKDLVTYCKEHRKKISTGW